MSKFFKYSLIFFVGGICYGFIEILYRGWTHWSMICAGGICLELLYFIKKKISAPIWKKWILGGAVITTVEFVAGGIVNILLGWRVWDYGSHSFNLLGQICPVISACWVLLSIPTMWLCSGLDKFLFERDRAK